jgi:hypothetical protein
VTIRAIRPSARSTPGAVSKPKPGIERASEAIDPIELYAAAVDASDYVASVAPLIRECVQDIGELLDVGAGGGQLGSALRTPNGRWTAIEPSPNMRVRLAHLHDPPRIIASGWEEAQVPGGEHDTVLAANIAAPLQEPNPFLARCLAWGRRTVVWVVPAQHGPRGMCFAGCLPAAWHGEDETPGVDVVLRGLALPARPHAITAVEWTFSGIVADIDELASYLAGRLGWPDSRRPDMAAHLARQARPDAGGYRLDIPRTSAVLVWTHARGGVGE